MDKVIYVVRHCKAEGQEPDAPLTAEGEEQAVKLSEFLEQKGIRHIVSSPFKRAIQSAEPAADRLGLQIEVDERLAERNLSTEEMPDWLERLEETFKDVDLKLKGGESSREAAGRARAVLKSVPDGTALVTHGNLMSLLLNHVDEAFGFNEWKTLSNPDVYRIEQTEGKSAITRIWE